MAKHIVTAAMLLAIVLLYGLAGALDNDNSELGALLDNLTHSN